MIPVWWQRAAPPVVLGVVTATMLGGCAVTAHPHYAYGPVKPAQQAAAASSPDHAATARVSTVALVRRVRVAPSAARASRTARFTIRVTAESSDGTASVGGSGALDFKRDVGTARLDLSSVTADGGHLDMVETPRAVYMHLPPQARAEFGGRPWVSVDLRAAAQRLGVSESTLAGQSRQADARSYLDALGGVASLHPAGREFVRGTPTIHYVGHISIKRVARAVAPAMRARVMAVLGTGNVALDAWLDSRGRPRRIEERFSVNRAIELDAVVDFFDYGVPVHVEIPPASQVSDITTTIG